MKLTDYKTLGNSGLKVSPFCLGNMTFGEDWGWGASEEVSHQMLDTYFNAGGNFIDTANRYTNGHSEEIIGSYFKEKGSRDGKVIATNFFGQMYHGDPNGGGAGRKNIIESCEQSLKRLQTDYIDLYWLHCYDKFTPVVETLRALDDLVTAGKVRYIGLSDIYAYKAAQVATIALLKNYAPVIALQIEYSLLERTVEGELIPLALDFGLGVTPWSPLKFGALSGKYTRSNRNESKLNRSAFSNGVLNDRTYDLIDLLQEIAAGLNTSVAKVALACLLYQTGVTSPIIGARTIEQLADNLGALELEIPQELLLKLDTASPSLNFPANFIKHGAGSFAYGGLTINGEHFSPRRL